MIQQSHLSKNAPFPLKCYIKASAVLTVHHVQSNRHEHQSERCIGRASKAVLTADGHQSNRPGSKRALY